MIDFNNKSLIKLNGEPVINGENAVKDLLIPNEIVLDSYVSVRDRVVFYNAPHCQDNFSAFLS